MLNINHINSYWTNCSELMSSASDLIKCVSIFITGKNDVSVTTLVSRIGRLSKLATSENASLQLTNGFLCPVKLSSLPPAYVVRGKVMFWHVSVCLSTGGVPISHDALQHYPECHGADGGVPCQVQLGEGVPWLGVPSLGGRGYPGWGIPWLGGTLAGGYPGWGGTLAGGVPN